MTTNSENRKPEDPREFTYYLPGRWVTYIVQAVTAEITGVMTTAITIVVTTLVLLGGVWLAYTYLPTTVFYIILAVLVVDAVLGIVLRAVISGKSGPRVI